VLVTKLKLKLGGAEAVVELAERDAPKTSKLLLSLLPVEERARHAMESGREVYIVLGESVEIPEENQTIYQTSLFIEPGWPEYANEKPVLSWVYERDTAIMGTYSPLATNVVGKIAGGLNKLQAEAPRMRREGFGLMKLSRL